MDASEPSNVSRGEDEKVVSVNFDHFSSGSEEDSPTDSMAELLAAAKIVVSIYAGSQSGVVSKQFIDALDTAVKRVEEGR